MRWLWRHSSHTVNPQRGRLEKAVGLQAPNENTAICCSVVCLHMGGILRQDSTGLSGVTWGWEEDHERVLQSSLSLGMGSGQAPDGSGEGHNNQTGTTGHIPNTSRKMGRTWQLMCCLLAPVVHQDWQVYQHKLLTVQRGTAILASGAGPAFKPRVIYGQMSSSLTGAQ